MSARRLVAGAGAVLATLLLGATPASAAEPTVQWNRPPPTVTTANDLVLQGTVTGDDGDKIESVTLALNPTGPAEPEGDRCRAVIDGQATITPEKPQTVPMDFQVPLKVPCNRTYEVSATITRPAPLGVCPHIGESCTTATSPYAFKVAIPPAQVGGLQATYDEGAKEVQLSWKANGEADLLGYRVERNPPGPTGFETVGQLVKGAAFTDGDITEQHRYRVVAVRAGPDGPPIEGKFSTAVAAGPGGGSGLSNSPGGSAPKLSSTTGASGGGPNAGSGGDRPTVRRRTATTVDSGFSQDLPFDPAQTTTTEVPSPTAEPEGDAAVLAQFDDGDDDDRRGTLVPIAGGLALLMGAVHVRMLSKRLATDDIPILPGT